MRVPSNNAYLSFIPLNEYCINVRILYEYCIYAAMVRLASNRGTGQPSLWSRLNGV